MPYNVGITPDISYTHSIGHTEGVAQSHNIGHRVEILLNDMGTLGSISVSSRIYL